MASSDETTAATEGEGVQQIPAQIQMQAAQPPAAVETRDKLLQAIGAEAQHIAEKPGGQASTALEQLARAYALVVSGGAVAPGAGAPVARRDAPTWGLPDVEAESHWKLPGGSTGV